jgi:hypothetical protein
MKKRSASSQIAALLKILDQAFDHHAWHGTNLRGSLRGLSAREAAWRPGRGRHNIWELALHCAYWKYAIRRRLLDEKRGAFAVNGSNFFARPADARERDQAWRADIALLEEEHLRLRAAVAAFPPKRLHLRTAPNGWTWFETIAGGASHDLYHAGQIQLLKRMQKR